EGSYPCRYTNTAARTAAISLKKSRASALLKKRYAQPAEAKSSASCPRPPCSSRAPVGTQPITQPSPLISRQHPAQPIQQARAKPNRQLLSRVQLRPLRRRRRHQRANKKI